MIHNYIELHNIDLIATIQAKTITKMINNYIQHNLHILNFTFTSMFTMQELKVKIFVGCKSKKSSDSIRILKIYSCTVTKYSFTSHLCQNHRVWNMSLQCIFSWWGAAGERGGCWVRAWLAGNILRCLLSLQMLSSHKTANIWLEAFFPCVCQLMVSGVPSHLLTTYSTLQSSSACCPPGKREKHL